MRDWLEDWWLPIAVLSVVLGLGVVGVVHVHRERARCTDNGGTWVRENCHEVADQICITTDYGNGMVITSCIPTTSTVCDSVCRGARAEAGR